MTLNFSVITGPRRMCMCCSVKVISHMNNKLVRYVQFCLIDFVTFHVHVLSKIPSPGGGHTPLVTLLYAQVESLTGPLRVLWHPMGSSSESYSQGACRYTPGDIYFCTMLKYKNTCWTIVGYSRDARCGNIAVSHSLLYNSTQRYAHPWCR